MEILNIMMAIVSIILGVISIILAISERKESAKINKETEERLLEIQNLSNNISKTSDRIENNIKTQIDRIINSNAPTQDEKMQQQLITALLPEMVKNPDIITSFAKLGNNTNNNHPNK